MLYTLASLHLLADPEPESALIQLYTQLSSLHLASRPRSPPEHPSSNRPSIKCKQSASIMPSTSTFAPATTPPPSPGLPPSPAGNLSARGLDTTNTHYPISYERTPAPELPFPHPKWHSDPRTGALYEVTSTIFEEYDPKSGYMDSVGPIRESVEKSHGQEKRDAGLELAEDARTEGGITRSWVGYVQWPESSERSSIAREAKRRREGEREDEKGEEKGKEESKRRRVR